MALRAGTLCAVGLLAVLATWVSPPVPQDPAYHQFADSRRLLGIPGFWNVATSLLFLAVGIPGLWRVMKGRMVGGLAVLQPAYAVFFAGAALVGIASAYYHLAPSNTSLLWDRLAMSVAFMGFFVAVLGERISPRLARWALWPLVATGLASVLYWYLTELRGAGDLRAYALVQFLPMLLIPLIWLLFRGPFVAEGWVWLALGLYLAAKPLELSDARVYAALGFGGHALKHLLAAAGGWCFLMALSRRRPRVRD